MVGALPAECHGWLVSKGRINALGNQLRAGHISGEVEWRERCYRLFRLVGLPPMFRALTGVLSGKPLLLAARLKRRNSLRAKLRRLVSIKLSQVADIIGFRVVCQSVADSKAVVTNIDSLGLPTKTRYHDPAPSGYRAIHLEVQVGHEFPSGRTMTLAIEVQVRTYYQHLWAMRSEAFGEQVKMGGGRFQQREYLDRLSTEIGIWEAENPDATQRALPTLAPSGGIAVVRQMPIGGQPLVEQFGLDSEEAADQLVEWEELTLGDTLFLAHSGSIDTIRTSHSFYVMGERLGVVLEPWMPQWSKEHQDRDEPEAGTERRTRSAMLRSSLSPAR